MYIEEILRETREKLSHIEEKQSQIIEMIREKEKPFVSDERLLTTHQVLQRLGLKPQQKGWVIIKTILKQKYGLKRHPGMGYRITEGNLKKYLQDNYNQS